VEDQISAIDSSVIASGAKLETGDLENFIGEQLTGFNSNLYIHDKFLLVDPLSSDPITVTGTANFSGTSQQNNDENMLVIRGDQRVADIYFGEFMCIFDHLYARYLVRKIDSAQIKAGKPKKTGGGYLKEQTAEWLDVHFTPGSRKDLRRRYFIV
jgi:phosphatidylserine/phosphatidylglycerophosphate/cardiolipin synthase-like enzyme